MKITKRRFLKAIAVAFILTFVGFHFAPLPEKLQGSDYATLLLAADNQLLAAKIATDGQWRFPPLVELPEKYRIAVVEFEDQYFYQHPGVNPVSLWHAFKSNLSRGRVVRGGSTITMQLARLLRGDPARTYTNKLIEIVLAFKLEWHFSKQEILLHYANLAPFGGNTVGISAAQWRYFKHMLNEGSSSMSWAEAAVLAVLPNSPALIHPGRGREKLLAKRNRLLKHLYEKELLDQNEFILSQLEDLPEKPAPLPQKASHLLHTAIAEYGHKQLFTTTLDTSIQDKVAAATRFYGRSIADQGIHNLSVVVMDNRSHQLKAYIGNSTPKAHLPQFAASVDITRRPRSTGSILKPVLYGLMLQDGDLLPDTLVPDIPSNFRGFTPENYHREYNGAVPAKYALAQSLNIPAVRMLHGYGHARFLDKLKAMQMTTLFRSADEYGLSLILGGAETNLWEMTNVYANLVGAARGELRASFPSSVFWLFDQQGALQENHKAQPFPLGAGAAWLTLEALREVKRPYEERGWQDFSSAQKIAWKTGTSYGLRDAWAIGSNGKYTVGVWSGNAAGDGVVGLSGVKTAAPLLFQLFDILGAAAWIEPPYWDLKQVRTCVADGYLANSHCDSELSWAPKHSHFQKVSPHFFAHQLDMTGAYRVHGGCEKVHNMQTQYRFMLPPAQAFYWRKSNSRAQALPDWRRDCLRNLAQYTDEQVMDIIYPQAGAKLYLPTDLDGKKQQAVFKASHRDDEMTLFWHIDGQYIGKTQHFHEIPVKLGPGWQKLTLVDERGATVERWVKGIGEQAL